MEDTTRKDKETEKKVRGIIGDVLRQLRQSNGLTLAQAADLTGSTPDYLAKLEDGEKGLNSVRMVQHIATIGGKITITPQQGDPIPLNAPALTDSQKSNRQRQRADSLKQEQARRQHKTPHPHQSKKQ